MTSFEEYVEKAKLGLSPAFAKTLEYCVSQVQTVQKEFITAFMDKKNMRVIVPSKSWEHHLGKIVKLLCEGLNRNYYKVEYYELTKKPPALNTCTPYQIKK